MRYLRYAWHLRHADLRRHRAQVSTTTTSAHRILLVTELMARLQVGHLPNPIFEPHRLLAKAQVSRPIEYSRPTRAGTRPRSPPGPLRRAPGQRRAEPGLRPRPASLPRRPPGRLEARAALAAALARLPASGSTRTSRPRRGAWCSAGRRHCPCSGTPSARAARGHLANVPRGTDLGPGGRRPGRAWAVAARPPRPVPPGRRP